MTEQRYLSFGQQKKYKFILVGDSNVGKTALFWRFIQGQFHADKSKEITTVDFRMKNITLKGKPAKLYIWDTAGQQRYKSIVSTYFKGCHGVLLIFDLSKPQSFQHATSSWYQLCKSKAEQATIMLVGNKSDLNNSVGQQKIKAWAKQKKLRYMSTSAKSGTNVEQVFNDLAKVISAKQQAPQKTQSFALGAENFKKNKGKKCC